MAKDYRKRESSRRQSSAPRYFLWVLTAFLGGYLAATVFDYTSLTTWINQQIAQSAQHGNSPAPAAVAKKPMPPKPKFEFYTLLAKDNHGTAAHPQPAVPVSRYNNQPAAAPTVQPAVQTIVQPPGQPSSPAAGLPPVTQAKAATVNPKMVAATVSAAMAKQAYLVQIAAFNRRQDAENLKASLVLKGFDVVITSTLQGKTTWYRVNVGPFSMMADAKTAQTNLARAQQLKTIIRKQ